MCVAIPFAPIICHKKLKGKGKGQKASSELNVHVLCPNQERRKPNYKLKANS